MISRFIPFVLALYLSAGAVAKMLPLTDEEKEILKEGGLTFDIMKIEEPDVPLSEVRKSEFDVDVYFVPSTEDWLSQDVRWALTFWDLSPLDKISDHYGNRGYRIPAELFRPSEHFEGYWYADVHVSGFRAPLDAGPEYQDHIVLEKGIASFNERIYINADKAKTWTYTRYLPDKGLVLADSTEEAISTDTSRPHQIYIFMKNFDKIRVILSASMKEHFAAEEDETDFGDSVVPVVVPAVATAVTPAVNIASIGAFLLAGFVLFNSMGMAASPESMEEYVYVLSRDY